MYQVSESFHTTTLNKSFIFELFDCHVLDMEEIGFLTLLSLHMNNSNILMNPVVKNEPMTISDMSIILKWNRQRVIETLDRLVKRCIMLSAELDNHIMLDGSNTVYLINSNVIKMKGSEIK